MAPEPQCDDLRSLNEGDRDFGALLWVVCFLYFLVLLAVVMITVIQKWGSITPGGLSEHYLGGRSIRSVTLALSVCASTFSGYTTVGLPAESFDRGFVALRWVGGVSTICLGLVSYAPRLHWLSRERGYDSNLAFVWDRFEISDPRRDLLHWTCVAVLLLPCSAYLVAQFVAFGSTLETLSGGGISRFWAMIVLMFLTVGFETAGGLRAVAITDVVQGVILISGSACFLVFVGTTFGGMQGVTECLKRRQPELVAVPDSAGMLSWVDFWVGVGYARSLFPDLMTRVMAANSHDSLRHSTMLLSISPLVVMLPMCLLGIVGAAYHQDLTNPDAAFAEVVMDIINDSAAGAVVGSVMLAATLAAIMSTADSVLIAVSHIVTLDVIRPFVAAAQTLDSDRQVDENRVRSELLLARLGRVVTGFVAAACIPVAMSGVNLGYLLELQNILIAQLVPVFVIALYWRGLCKKSALSGLLTGIALGVPLTVTHMPGPTLISLSANVFVSVAISAALSRRNSGRQTGASRGIEHSSGADKGVIQMISWAAPRSGGQQRKACAILSAEPLRSRWLCMPLLSLALAVPWYREQGAVDPIALGFPVWALLSLSAMTAANVGVLSIVARRWRQERETPERAATRTSSGRMDAAPPPVALAAPGSPAGGPEEL